MKVLALRIRGFRGIETADLVLDDHCVLIGPNGIGKSTVIDALCLVFGRSKLVPVLTEHDFRGSTPDRATRITIIATLGGFAPDDPEAHRGNWFRHGRAIEKFWNAAQKKALPERASPSDPLCVEIGFCARFDHDELTVEQVRYFHDDDDVSDPFDDGVAAFPSALLNEVGFYVLPARRTWELTASFVSELFRKAVSVVGGLPSSAVLDIRETVRNPATPIEADTAIAPLVQAVNDKLEDLLPSAPQFQIRLTATDSESVLRALVPHYAESEGPSLPAGRHGGGLLALQTLILLLEIGRTRRQRQQSFILALEEPELHVPPGLQRKIVSEATAAADQTICTTHSPRIATCYSAERVHIFRRFNGKLRGNRLLPNQALSLPNSARKLFNDHRHRLLEALMYQFVLVPEGRIDFEFLRLLIEVSQGNAGNGASRFETTVGIVPTQDASVVDTATRLLTLGADLLVVVDGDQQGDRYVSELLALPTISNDSKPNGDPIRRGARTILQWQNGASIEDVVGWISRADPAVVADISNRLRMPIETPDDLVARLKEQQRPQGLKTNYLAYEEIAHALRVRSECSARAKQLLEEIAAVGAGLEAQSLFRPDAARSTPGTTVLQFWPT